MQREFEELIKQASEMTKLAKKMKKQANSLTPDDELQWAHDRLLHEVMSAPRKNMTFGNPDYSKMQGDIAREQYNLASKFLTPEQRKIIDQNLEKTPIYQQVRGLELAEQQELANHPKTLEYKAKYGYNPFTDY